MPHDWRSMASLRSLEQADMSKGATSLIHAFQIDFGRSAQGRIPQSTQSTLAKVKEFVFGL